MEYSFNNNRIYYRFNKHFHWSLMKDDDIRAMMEEEKQNAFVNLNIMVFNQFDSPNTTTSEIIEWQLEMSKGINKWYNKWNIRDYSCVLFERLTTSM